MSIPQFNWSDWLVKLDPVMQDVLSLIDRHRDALSVESTEGLVYKRLGQAQLRQFEDLGTKHGIFKRSYEGWNIDFAALKQMQLTAGMLRAAVFSVSQRHQTLRAYRFAKKILSQDLLEGMHRDMQSGSFFSAFAAMKVFLENLAEMDRLVTALAEVRPGGDARRAGEMYDKVLSYEFASPLDWARVPTKDLRQTEDPRTLRSDSDSKRDEAQEAQKSIAALGKRAKGIPAVYAILSEYVRPRAGTFWLVYEDSQVMQDGHKTQWNRNKLGPGFPRIMVEQMTPTIVQIFSVLKDALNIMQQIDKDLVDADARIAQHTRDETRSWLWHFPDLFDKHEDCPCGSNKRVKYCCGQ
jgi:hypothetical protein